MAATFVPLPFFADWTAARTSRATTRRESPAQTTAPIHHKTSAPECTSGLRGAGASEESWTSSRPGPGVLNGSSKPLEGGDWVERPHVPTLLGYEILEERAKFTIFKILVTGGQGKSWVIFRRFADFCRLHGKLKKLFPSCGLTLPPKRWFKDNYNEEFLERRRIGLQTYLQELTQNKDVISCESVRRFLCLLDPPSPFDSLEESRAFCETLEETNHRLQRELTENQKEVDVLKKKLEEKEKQMSLLVTKVNALPGQPPSFPKVRLLQRVRFITWGRCVSRSWSLGENRGLEEAASDPGSRNLTGAEVSVYRKRITSPVISISIIIITIMRKVTAKHFSCLLLLVFPLSWAEDTKRDPRTTENETVWSPVQTRRLFARLKVSPPQESHTPANRWRSAAPARRCGRLMESCSPHLPCCDPCASCRCRLFNTICYCWRMKPMCT
ncbi:uncharacterized protein V6R79_004160 [Siganus canaliculatus]